MTGADDITNLQEQLAAHRRTLAHLLTQRAYFDAGLVPSHVAHGIAEARSEIARCAMPALWSRTRPTIRRRLGHSGRQP
jgi:hypothetical protein